MRKKGVNLSELIVGLLLILLGIFTFVCPDSMLTGAVVIYGITIIAMGALDIVIYIKLSRFNGFGPMLSLITGILSVMCGVMLLANPNAGKWALTVLLPLWFISHCISGLSRIGLVRLFGSRPYYLFSLILNILGLMMGIFMIFSPALSFLTVRIVSYMAAFYMVLFGAESVLAAFARRR